MRINLLGYPHEVTAAVSALRGQLDVAEVSDPAVDRHGLLVMVSVTAAARPDSTGWMTWPTGTLPVNRATIRQALRQHRPPQPPASGDGDSATRRPNRIGGGGRS
jgi:hypothetical protein